MKAGEAGGSMLMSALNACRARLKAFIRGRTSVRDDADDILQEVTYQLMKVEQPVENVAAWLFRAARNEMTDRARKNARCRSPAILRMKTRARKTSWPKPCSAYRKRRKRSTSKRCCGKSWGRHCLNFRRRSGGV
jgi:DNA-directed RNA polymerase specialized sigma24 family protein